VKTCKHGLYIAAPCKQCKAELLGYVGELSPDPSLWSESSPYYRGVKETPEDWITPPRY
jgi:hypothetical protein